MAISFSGSELVNVAIGIERNGIVFYDIMARSTENAAARAIFQQLSRMEREHLRIFQEMLDGMGKAQPPQAYTDEYAEYVKNLIDSAVFTDDVVSSEMATNASSDIEALELGIHAEKDSILFYYEMRDLMPEPALPAINNIITEEKFHLSQLTKFKREIASR